MEKGGISWKPEVIAVAPPPISKELKKRWSCFIRKVKDRLTLRVKFGLKETYGRLTCTQLSGRAGSSTG